MHVNIFKRSGTQENLTEKTEQNQRRRKPFSSIFTSEEFNCWLINSDKDEELALGISNLEIIETLIRSACKSRNKQDWSWFKGKWKRGSTIVNIDRFCIFVLKESKDRALRKLFFNEGYC